MLGKAGTRCSKKKVPWRGRGHLGSTAPQMSECQSSRCKKSRVRVLQISEGSAGASDSLLCSQAARRKLFWVGAMAVSLLRGPVCAGTSSPRTPTVCYRISKPAGLFISSLVTVERSLSQDFELETLISNPCSASLQPRDLGLTALFLNPCFSICTMGSRTCHGSPFFDAPSCRRIILVTV